MTLSRTGLFRFLVCLALGAALYHVVGAFGGLQGNPASPIRHVLFVMISLIAAWYFVKRPIALLPLYVILVVQQTMSRGGRALHQWRSLGTLDVLSIVDLTAIYLGLVLLILDARDRSPFVRRLVCPSMAAR